MTSKERIDLITALVELIKTHPNMSQAYLEETLSVIQAQYKFLRS